MGRRTYLKSVSGAALDAGLAGCLGGETERGPVGEWVDGTIEFGLPPFQDEEKLLEQSEGVFNWLEEGYDDVGEVEGIPTTSYSAVVESVVQGHTELANLSPVIFVLAEGERSSRSSSTGSTVARATTPSSGRGPRPTWRYSRTSRGRRSPRSTCCRRAAGCSPGTYSRRRGSTPATWKPSPRTSTSSGPSATTPR